MFSTNSCFFYSICLHFASWVMSLLCDRCLQRNIDALWSNDMFGDHGGNWLVWDGSDILGLGPRTGDPHWIIFRTQPNSALNMYLSMVRRSSSVRWLSSYTLLLKYSASNPGHITRLFSGINWFIQNCFLSVSYNVIYSKFIFFSHSVLIVPTNFDSSSVWTTFAVLSIQLFPFT